MDKSASNQIGRVYLTLIGKPCSSIESTSEWNKMMNENECLENMEQQVAQRMLTDLINRGESISTETLWSVLSCFQNYPFHTFKGLEFTYTVKGHEMFVNRKEKSITSSSVEIALAKIMELHGRVSGPKKLKVFGASYLYPVFIHIGLINDKNEKEMDTE